MAQHAFPQVALPAERVDQRAVLAPCHGVDRQVTTTEIFLERYIRCGVKAETSMAAPTLALGSRQRVFLVGIRVEEHGEIAPDRPKTKPAHRFRCGTHD